MEKDKVSNITGGVFWAFAERISAQLVSALVGIILARILLPEDYGAVSIVMVFITICNVFVTSGFGAAIVQKKEVDKTDYDTAFILSLVMSVVLYCVLFIIAPFVADFYKMPVLRPVIRVLGIRLILTSLNTIQQAHVQREMQFRKFFISTLFGTVVSCIVGVIMAYSGCGVWALVCQYLTNTAIDTIVLAFVGGWNPGFKFSKTKAKEIYSFGGKVLCTELIFTLEGDIRSLIVGKVFGSADLAYYDQGRKYPSLIVGNINSALTKVLLPALSREQDNLYELTKILRKCVMIGCYLLCPLLIGFAAVADDFVTVVLTEKWAAAVPFIIIFCFSYLTRPIETACHQALLAIGRSGIVFWIIVSINVVGIASVIVSVFVLQSVLWIALFSLVCTAVSLVCFLISAKVLIGYGFKEQLSDMCPAIGMSLVMGAIVYLFEFIDFSVYLKLTAQVLTGIIIYIALSVLTKNKSWNFIISYLKEKFRKKKQ